MAEVIDRVGQKFGKLTVIRRGPPTPSGASWVCECACGAIETVTAANLRSTKRQCVSCYQESKRADFVGRRFGRLLVESFSHVHRHRSYWRCKCDCGEGTIASSQNLSRGQVQSCGCLARERAGEAVRKHGMSDHPVYTAWENMRQRCLNEKSPWFHRYGGRGITICDRWSDAQAFIDDMLPSWSPGLTIDRVDPDGNYEPSNCRWITQTEQLSNRSDTIWLEIDGEKMPIALASKRFGVNAQTIRYRWHHGYRGRDLITRPK